MLRRALSVLAVASALLIGLAGTASAGVPDVVDQSTLQPPLNPNFSYRCFASGDAILCQGTFDPAWSNEDTGLTCAGHIIYTTGAGHERLSRWHLADGRAIRTIVQLHYDEVWSLSPTGSGPTVQVQGDWNRHYTYPSPGDRGSRVLTEVGSSWRVSAAGEGVIAHDSGLIQYAPGLEFEEAVIVHGPKDSTDFDGVVVTICEVLMP